MNLLLVVCDTLRSDHLGCYGYFRDTSPNIDNIAKEGAVFDDFYCAGAPTGIGFTCINTGLYPINHKFYRFTGVNVRQVDDRIFTMAEILRASGYTTAAFDNLINQTRSKHFVRGYEFYVNCGDFLSGIVVHALRAEQVNMRLIPWIKNHSDEEFFAFIHYWDPHTPYNQPKEYQKVFNHKQGDLSDLEIKEAPAGYQYVPGWGRVKELVEGEIPDRHHKFNKVSVDRYDGEIVYMDHAIGDVMLTLEEEEILEDTLTIITADHGEQLGQHGVWEHDMLLDSVVHIPLVMRCPKKLPRGIKVKGYGQQIDILPTILELIGSQSKSLKFDGTSLMRLLSGEPSRERIFIEHTSGERCIRTDEWKLIADEWAKKQHKPLELYNTKEDPLETNNLANSKKEKAHELIEILHEWVENNLKGETDPAIFEKEEEYTGIV
jgi:arylsulfatase A-like enzyme